MVWLLFVVRPSVKQVMAMVVALSGIILIVLPDGQLGLGNLSSYGMICAVGSAVANSIAFIGIGRLADTDSPEAMNLWLALMGILVSVPIMLASPLPSSFSLIATALLYGVFGLVGQTLMIVGTTRLSPEAGSTGGSLIPVFAALFGWTFLGEYLGHLEILGVGIVVAGTAAVSVVASHHDHQGLPNKPIGPFYTGSLGLLGKP